MYFVFGAFDGKTTVSVLLEKCQCHPKSVVAYSAEVVHRAVLIR